MATDSSILAWEIPWTEEPGGLHPWGGKRVGHDFMTEQQQHMLIIAYNLNYLPKTQTSNMITLRGRVSVHEFGGTPKFSP